MNEFKDMLKYFRQASGYSQLELAKLLNVSASTISMYEVGKRHPDFETEERIADLFNVDLNTLRGKTTEEYTFQNEAIFDAFQKNAAAFGVISKEESELLDLFRSASEDKKVSILNVVRALVE